MKPEPVVRRIVGLNSFDLADVESSQKKESPESIEQDVGSLCCARQLGQGTKDSALKSHQHLISKPTFREQLGYSWASKFADSV